MARPVPTDLEDALAASPAARERFGTLPPEQLDEWIGWVERARLPGARRRRIAELVRRLSGRRPVAARIVETHGAAAPPPPRDAWLPWVVALALVAGIAALVVWFTVYRHDSAKPGAVVVSAKATVPQVVGIRQQAATFQLQQAKLAVTVVKRAGARPRGIVVGQNPKAGAAVPQGSPVTIAVSNGPPGVKVPSVVGLAAADAAKQLGALKLATTLKPVSSKQPPGTVLAQKPPAGKVAKPGTAVVLEVAGSKASVAVPDVKGQTERAAVASLKQAGLTATVAQVPSSQPAGTVVAQHPAAAQKAAKGSAVRLNVSKGGATQTQTQTSTQQQTTTQSSAPPPPPQQGSGNDYRGMQLSAAVDKILQGRQQVIVEWIASSRPKGIVVANATAGARERLQVSAGTQPAPATAVPDVSGESQSQATNDLQSAGFTVITASWPVSDQTRNGVVVYETPSGGGTAPRGATIVVYIGSASGG